MFGRVNTFFLSLFVFAAPVFARAAEVAEHGAEEGGGSMPQLDPTFYPSQIFWLAITFGLMFFLMTKVALPRVARMVQSRDDQVRRDLEKAYRLRREAEDMQMIYSRSLRDADEKAKIMMDKIVTESRAKQATAMQETHDRIARKITETEQHLRGEKTALLKESTTMADRLSKSIISALTVKA